MFSELGAVVPDQTPRCLGGGHNSAVVNNPKQAPKVNKKCLNDSIETSTVSDLTCCHKVQKVKPLDKELGMNQSTEEETKDSNQTDYVSESEAINPKCPSTWKKTRQVHNTDFKLQVIKWHLEEKAAQLQTAN